MDCRIALEGASVVRPPCLVVGILMLTASVWGEDLASRSEEEISRLLNDNGLYRNHDAIVEAAAGLSEGEQDQLYWRHRSKAAGPLFLSLYLGMGLGSFVQGDTTGGLVGLGVESLLYVSLITYWQVRPSGVPLSCLFSAMTPADELAVWLFGVSLFGSRLYQAVRNVRYSSRYNEDLLNTLRGE